LGYGIATYLLTVVVIAGITFALHPAQARSKGPALLVFQALVGAVFALGFALLIFLLSHLCAKQFLRGTGTFIGVLGPLLLASWVQVAILVPILGPFVAGAWWGIAVVLWVFEEVHHVERIKMLVIIVVLNLCIAALRFGLAAASFSD
jgi:hypothetical protein